MMRGGAAVVIDGGGTELNLDGGPQRSEGADAQQRCVWTGGDARGDGWRECSRSEACAARRELRSKGNGASRGHALGMCMEDSAAGLQMHTSWSGHGEVSTGRLGGNTQKAEQGGETGRLGPCDRGPRPPLEYVHSLWTMGCARNVVKTAVGQIGSRRSVQHGRRSGSAVAEASAHRTAVKIS